jgi:hypothetical protein
MWKEQDLEVQSAQAQVGVLETAKMESVLENQSDMPWVLS